MTAKEYLKQMWLIDKEINEKFSQLEYLRAKAESCHSPKLTGMPGGSGPKDRVSDLVIKIAELQKYLDEQTDKLINLKTKITKQIHGLKSQRSRVILEARYLRDEEGRKWERIEEDLHYEHSTLMKAHRKALKDFERRYPKIRRL